MNEQSKSAASGDPVRRGFETLHLKYGNLASGCAGVREETAENAGAQSDAAYRKKVEESLEERT